MRQTTDANQTNSTDADTREDIAFLRLPQVKAATGLSKTSIYEKIKEDTFPSPVPIGKRAIGWIASEIRQWALAQVEAAREETAPRAEESPAWPCR